MLTLNKFAKKKKKQNLLFFFTKILKSSHWAHDELQNHKVVFAVKKEVETLVACLWCSTSPAPDFAAAVFFLWIALCFNSHLCGLFACSTAAPLLLLHRICLTAASVVLRLYNVHCACTHTPPGCRLVLLLVIHCRSTLVLAKTCAALLETTLTPVHSFTTSTFEISHLWFSVPATRLAEVTGRAFDEKFRLGWKF